MKSTRTTKASPYGKHWTPHGWAVVGCVSGFRLKASAAQCRNKWENSTIKLSWGAAWEKNEREGGEGNPGLVGKGSNSGLWPIGTERHIIGVLPLCTPPGSKTCSGYKMGFVQTSAYPGNGNKRLLTMSIKTKAEREIRGSFSIRPHPW